MAGSVTGTVGDPKSGKRPSAPVAPPVPSRHPVVRGRNILLFSDGTGNSSAKLFKTNVWRMYEAVDLGPSEKGELQVAYYDNGVGNQQVRVLAMLAGILGIGLKSNILRIYRYACRNGDADCRFYCFGFSRGAYTIRLVAAMIAKYGLVRYSNESELEARVRDTFRAFMRTNNPNVTKFVGKAGRAVRDIAVAIKRALIGPRLKIKAVYVPTTIQFLGVWDTVAAYGGPVSEITRGIDDYIWPLTMTDSCLNADVRFARQALSIDDERDAFQPVLWDEVDWDSKARKAHPDDESKQDAFRKQLKQVWFAGMHADVGGGYPDESLSYVSLLWMMQEAQDAGLRLLDDNIQRYRDLANSLGPIHNSRGGLGAYYRPQPRKIAAFLHKKSGMDLEDATLGLRDPVLGEEPKPPHGLLLGCRVHESVIARLKDGTDDYAPATLPPQISVEPYSKTARVKGVKKSLLNQLSVRNDEWYACQERIWDFVFWRRVVYFAAATATFLFATLPWWVNSIPYPATADGRAVMVRMTSWSRYVPIEPARPWIEAFQVNWLLFVGLLVQIGAMTYAGVALEGTSRSRSYRLWRERLTGGTLSLLPPGLFTRLRTSRYYQRSLQVVKWRVMPVAAAFLLVATTVWLGLAGITQAIWSLREPSLCPRQTRMQFESNAKSLSFDPRSLCTYTGVRVQREHRYEVTFKVDQPWRDASIRATPAGVRTSDMVWKQSLFSPFRRLADGRYLQPAVEVRPPDHADDYVPRTQVRLLDPVWEESRRAYVATFTARQSGDLYLFLNDAAFLGLVHPFYLNNHGRSTVMVRDLYEACGADCGSPEPSRDQARR